MFSIGDFANLGRVSVRMLRHYDAIGLLRPARVDPHSGYRSYTAEQLSLLNRVTALKDLGFTLHQVQSMIDDKVDVRELRGMLRLRRAQLTEQVAADTARLARVEARLRMIESEGHMDTAEVVVKAVPAVRVAHLSAVAASYEPPDIGPALSPLYPELARRMAAAGVPCAGPPMAYYLPAPAGPGDEAITVHAAFPVAGPVIGPVAGPVTGRAAADVGFEVVELPAIAHAATLLHHGPMSGADRSMQVLARWLDDNGHRTVGPGYAREVYLDCPMDDESRWVTELQLEVRPGP